MLGGVLSENNLVIVKRDASPSCKPLQIKSMQPLVSAPFHFHQPPPPSPSLSLSFFFSCVDTQKDGCARTHTQKDTYRRRETGSLNLKDFLDKVDKDIFITLLLHTLGIIAEGKNRSAKDTAQHMNVDRRHNAT